MVQVFGRRSVSMLDFILEKLESNHINLVALEK